MTLREGWEDMDYQITPKYFITIMSQTHSLRPGSIYMYHLSILCDHCSVNSFHCEMITGIMIPDSLSFNSLLTPGMCPVSINSLGLIRNVHYTNTK